MNIWKGYLRWRHSKGFGVHSPFAYRFITDVLNPGSYGYYAYDQIEFLSRGLNKERRIFFREVKFLIRLAIFLDIKRIVTVGKKLGEAQIAAKALKIVYYGCETNSSITFKPHDLLIIPSGVEANLDVLKKALENRIPVFAVNPVAEVRKFLEIPQENGLLFRGKSKMILVPRKEMKYLAYDIKW